MQMQRIQIAFRRQQLMSINLSWLMTRQRKCLLMGSYLQVSQVKDFVFKKMKGID